mgnify:FL=1
MLIRSGCSGSWFLLPIFERRKVNNFLRYTYKWVWILTYLYVYSSSPVVSLTISEPFLRYID